MPRWRLCGREGRRSAEPVTGGSDCTIESWTDYPLFFDDPLLFDDLLFFDYPLFFDSQRSVCSGACVGALPGVSPHCGARYAVGPRRASLGTHGPDRMARLVHYAISDSSPTLRVGPGPPQPTSNRRAGGPIVSSSKLWRPDISDISERTCADAPVATRGFAPVRRPRRNLNRRC